MLLSVVVVTEHTGTAVPAKAVVPLRIGDPLLSFVKQFIVLTAPGCFVNVTS